MKLFSMFRRSKKLKKLAQIDREAVAAHKRAIKTMNQAQQKANEFKETMEANGITIQIISAIGGPRS